MSFDNLYGEACKRNDDLKRVLRKYHEAAVKFINKVDTGKAKSKETYFELKICEGLFQSVMGECETEECEREG